MLKNLKSVLKGKFIVAAGVVGLTAVVGLTLTPTSDVNAASTKVTEKCRVFNATNDWYEAGQVASKEYFVPGSSDCDDINVRNIKNMDPNMPASHPDKYCAKFKVAMYPKDKTKEVYYSKQVKVCSQDPSSSSTTNGPVRVLATDVYTGTRYRVLYAITNQETPITYQIVD
jgi:hypothetical protein